MTCTTSPGPPNVARVLVRFTAAARATITAACPREGSQTIIVSWPAGAAYLPSTCFTPGRGDVMIGRVAGCPIYADTRCLAVSPARRMLLDVERSSPTSPASTAALGHTMTPAPAPATVMAEQRYVAAVLVGDLAPRFAGRFGQDGVTVCVGQAVADLRGSVCAEALTEMAARPAHHRLTVASERQRPDAAVTADSPRADTVHDRAPVTGHRS
jgi:hypothetical protein